MKELKQVRSIQEHDGHQQKAENLLFRVLEHIGDELKENSKNVSTNIGQEVLLEVQFQGHQYKVIRCQPTITTTSIPLSPREDEIVRMVAQGLPNKGIAQVLDISPWTVATHLRRVFNKLGVSTRAEMIARVMENNLLDEPKKINEV